MANTEDNLPTVPFTRTPILYPGQRPPLYWAPQTSHRILRLALNCIRSQNLPRFLCTILSYPILYCSRSQYLPHFLCTILSYPIQCRTVLCHTLLHCTALYCTIYYTLLCCTILYYTILYCTALYRTVLHCSALYLDPTPTSPPTPTPVACSCRSASLLRSQVSCTLWYSLRLTSR